jgi:dihydroorotate dehydrogenase electron transfer subunit
MENRRLSGGSHLLRVAAPEARAAAPVSHPGQFAQLLAHPSVHLVRRPMSIHDEGDGWRTYMVKPVGPASRELTALQPGDSLDVSPPLGCGFPPPAELAGARLILVGGGFGIAPLHFLARRLDAVRPEIPYTLVYGGRTGADVELDVLEDVRGPVVAATDDGSRGFHGSCVDAAAAAAGRDGRDARHAIVLACGSHGMMQALHRALHGRVARVLVSLEEVMACGVGVCMGCVTPSVRGYVPICTAGPVFPSADVFDVPVGVAHV